MNTALITSPHLHKRVSTSGVMGELMLASMPGFAVLCWFFGWGVVFNTALAILFCLLFEGLALLLRRRPVLTTLLDGSACVSALLLALALPPYAEWWLIACGSFFAIVVAKHLYGGLGFNPFNPAMVAYVVLLISFPAEMIQWSKPIATFQSYPGFYESFAHVFGIANMPDAFTSATPLDALKHRGELEVSILFAQHEAFQNRVFAGAAWEWINVGFLLGGLFLLYRRIFTWHAPVGMLAAILILSVVFYRGGGAHSAGSPVLHLFSGATMLGAFFIVTDPVTSASSNKGRFIYGFATGVLVFVIRVWGNYADAVAFSVLLMNFAAPFIDYYTVPRVYGHEKAQSIIARK